jgi:AP-2 complex subunit alpha
MPPWPEDKESALEARLRKKQEAAEDRIPAHQKSLDQATSAAAAAAGMSGGGGGPMSPTAAGSGGKKQQGGANVLDDLLDLSGGGEGLSTSSTATAAPAALDNDLLGGGGCLGLSTGGGAVVGVTEEMRPRLAAAFKALVTAPAGVLFENESLQVGVKHEYKGSQGRVGLFYGNKSGGELVGFAAAVGAAPSLRVQVAQDVQGSVGPGQQARQQLLVEAMRPFDYAEAPTLTVSFTLQGRAHSYELPLPVVPTGFCEPVTLAAGDFMARWRSLEGQNRERQEIVQQPAGFSFEPAAVAAFKQRVVEGLHLAQAPGVDTTEASLSVAGSFRTGATGADGNKLSVGALLRVEFNAQIRAVRITSRAVHGTIAGALVNTVKALVLS